MGFRFRNIVKLLPGVRLNISKSGISTSIGGPGATINLSSKGTRQTVGLPGSGLSFSTFNSNTDSEDTGDGGGNAVPSRKSTGCGWAVLALVGLLAIGLCSRQSPIVHDPALPPASGAAAKFQRDETVVVTASSLNGRSEPSASGNVVGKLRAGSEVQVVDRSGEWLKVIKDGTTLWILASHVANRRPAQAQALVQAVSPKSRIVPKPRPSSTSRSLFGKVCKRGKPCGNACISRNRVCHK
jgi:SH3-like domain-containing protein